MSCKHTYENFSRLGDIREDIRESQNDPLPLGVYVDQKSLVFPELISFAMDLDTPFEI